MLDAHGRRDGIRIADRDQERLLDGIALGIGALHADVVTGCTLESRTASVCSSLPLIWNEALSVLPSRRRASRCRPVVDCGPTVCKRPTRLPIGWPYGAKLVERAMAVGGSRSIVAVAVTGLLVLPARSVSVTLKVTGPSGKAERLMPVTSCVAEVTLPLPVTGDPPLPEIV